MFMCVCVCSAGREQLVAIDRRLQGLQGRVPLGVPITQVSVCMFVARVYCDLFYSLTAGYQLRDLSLCWCAARERQVGT